MMGRDEMKRGEARRWWHRAAAAAIALGLLGLLGGPAAAACTACCPVSDAPSFIAAPACCGDCATSMTRSPELASAVIKSVAAPFPLPLAGAGAAHEPAPRTDPGTPSHIDVRVRSGPGSARTPLRL
jgi:hypothetical protein